MPEELQVEVQPLHKTNVSLHYCSFDLEGDVGWRGYMVVYEISPATPSPLAVHFIIPNKR